MPNAYSYPPMVIIHNLPYETEHNRVTGRSFSSLRDHLSSLGYPITQQRPIWNGETNCFMRAVVMEFESDMARYRQAFKLQRAFERAGKGKADYENQLYSTAGPHAWVVTAADYVFTKEKTFYALVPNDLIVGGYYDADKDTVSTYASVMRLLSNNYPRFYSRTPVEETSSNF